MLECAGELADQSKSEDRGGTVKGVPWADPKCWVFRLKMRLVTSAGLMIRFHEVACLGGVLSVGTSS